MLTVVFLNLSAMSSKVATLEALDTHWSLMDMADAHEALDLQEQTEIDLAEKQRKESTRR